jgi:hypothetical protein
MTVSSRSPAYRWQCITDSAAFAPRDGAGALVFHDRMWLLGGWNPGDKEHFPLICNSEVWSSADGRDWRRELLAAPWEGRHTAGYAVHDDAMWIIGGDCNQGHYQDDVWRSADGINWTCVCEQVPWAPRALHHTVVFDGRIWVIGGQTMPEFAPGQPECFYNDVWCSVDGRDWECVQTAAAWTPRGMVGGWAVKDARMWLIGGGTYDTPTTPSRISYNGAWSSTDGVSWRLHGGASAESADAVPWAPRHYHEIAMFDDRLWVLEGYNPESGNRRDVWHSADGETWEELPDTPWAPRHAASVFVYDDALWMVAGNNMTSDVWKLTRTN